MSKDIEDSEYNKLDLTNKEKALVSIAISLKRIADSLEANDKGGGIANFIEQIEMNTRG